MEKVNRLIYAGQSHRRKLFLTHLTGEEPMCVGGGNEDDIPDVARITAGKLDFGLAALTTLNISDQASVISADTRTRVFASKNGDVPRLNSKGKPIKAEDVRQTFGEMLHAVEKTGTNPFYQVVSASGFHKGDNRQIDTRTCRVELNADVLRYLATEDGFNHYQESFRSFYSTGSYHKNGLALIAPTDLSSGISLPVLVGLGCVDSIDGVKRVDSGYKEALKQGIYTVGIGFSPKVLASISDNAKEKIANWSWLNGAAESALLSEAKL